MNEIRIGDCRQIMKLLILGNVKVQTCVTSPPYFGLRDYEISPSVWGGDLEHAHVFKTEEMDTEIGRGNWTQAVNGRGEEQPGGLEKSRAAIVGKQTRGMCQCGAWLGCLGLESTPEMYIDHILEVFRLVRELLADDGTLWLNMGDSYNAGTTAASDASKHADVGGWTTRSGDSAGAKRVNGVGYKVKDLMGMPWRVALALRDDGWYLRSDIIWHKPNPMPESVTDRPTKSHEYLFLLSKSANYFYDADAIMEATAETTKRDMRPVTNLRPERGYPGGYRDHGNGRPGDRERRNRRTVWTIPTEGFGGAHFATFPRDLILPCVLAGSRPGDIVFDPFMGSGTTALVAKENGRQYLGSELNPAYRTLQEERLRQEVLFCAGN